MSSLVVCGLLAWGCVAVFLLGLCVLAQALEVLRGPADDDPDGDAHEFARLYDEPCSARRAYAVDAVRLCEQLEDGRRASARTVSERLRAQAARLERTAGWGEEGDGLGVHPGLLREVELGAYAAGPGEPERLARRRRAYAVDAGRLCEQLLEGDRDAARRTLAAQRERRREMSGASRPGPVERDMEPYEARTRRAWLN